MANTRLLLGRPFFIKQRILQRGRSIYEFLGRRERLIYIVIGGGQPTFKWLMWEKIVGGKIV